MFVTIEFEKFKGLSYATVKYSENQLEFELFSKEDLKKQIKNNYENIDEFNPEPTWSVKIENFNSSDFMQKARDIYDSSKLSSLVDDFQLVDKGKKTFWGIPTNDENQQPIHSEEYIEYGIYAHLEPLFKQTSLVFIKLIGTIGINLVKGTNVSSWIPEGTVYNGMFLRRGAEISGKLPTSSKQLRKWNPTEMKWR